MSFITRVCLIPKQYQYLFCLRSTSETFYHEDFPVHQTRLTTNSPGKYSLGIK